MPPEPRHDVGFLGLLVKVLQALEVCEVLLFVCVLREGDSNVFTGNPLIEVVFNLKFEFV
jgi:hypothetical protein